MKQAATILLLLIATGAAAQTCGRVVSVHDGDTFRLLAENGDTVRVRLQGIDCPELDHPFGDKAQRYTEALLLGREVELQQLGKDKYRRTLALVKLPDGRILNELLLADGLAWQDKRFSRRKAWQEIEARARTQGVGLWRCK